MNDYSRVATVIRHLDEHHACQPTLTELASACGLSAAHFHRLFHRWAGVTPKDFLQCLTLEHAKRRLCASASVLDAALEMGLSGLGRLHDLFVTLEAVSPGEFKRGGEGLHITWGTAESPFGRCSLGCNARGICHLAFHDADDLQAEPTELRDGWPNAAFRRDDHAARRQVELVFQPARRSSKPPGLFVRATQFQGKVRRALLQIPEGFVASYRAIAAAMGNPGAARAVGAACGANPIAYLIPCHRVIRETGVVRGYRWGDSRKRALLVREAARAPVSAAAPVG